MPHNPMYDCPSVTCEWCHANLDDAVNVVEYPDGKGCDYAFCNEEHRALFLNPESIHNIREFADRFGCNPTPDALSHAVYNSTECGAFIKLESLEGYHDTIVLGSIIEGSEVETEVYRLSFPFAWQTYEAAVRAIEIEADALWNEAHEGEDD